MSLNMPLALVNTMHESDVDKPNASTPNPWP